MASARISVTEAGGTQAYLLYNGLGSTAGMVDVNGNSISTYTYDVYGAVRSQGGTASTEFTFTGEQNDPNGLEYLRARYYDPATGRFLSQDPLGGGYPYAGGNPANFVDPSGLYPICGDDPVWGYICFDSTQVGLPACDATIGGPDGCTLYGGDGAGPLEESEVIPLVDMYGDACVFANADLWHCYSPQVTPDGSPVEFTDAELEWAYGTVSVVEEVLTATGQKQLTQAQIRVIRAGISDTSNGCAASVVVSVSIAISVWMAPTPQGFVVFAGALIAEAIICSR